MTQRRLVETDEQPQILDDFTAVEFRDNVIIRLDAER